jgi:hypothetical protein
MRSPFIQYLIGAGILCVGLMILLSSAEIAHGLNTFWERWTGKRPRTLANKSDTSPPFYRTRLTIWRVLGALIVADGLVWIALATAELLHFLPRSAR